MCIVCENIAAVHDELCTCDTTGVHARMRHVVLQALRHFQLLDVDVRVVDPDHVDDTIDDCILAIATLVHDKHAVGYGVARDIDDVLQHDSHVQTREAYRNMIGEQFAHALTMLSGSQRAPLN